MSPATSARDFSFLRYACRRHVARGEEKRGEERGTGIDRRRVALSRGNAFVSRETLRCTVTRMQRFRKKRERPGYVYPMIQRTRPIVGCTELPEVRAHREEASDGLARPRDEQTRREIARESLSRLSGCRIRTRPRRRRKTGCVLDAQFRIRCLIKCKDIRSLRSVAQTIPFNELRINSFATYASLCVTPRVFYAGPMLFTVLYPESKCWFHINLANSQVLFRIFD